MINKLVIKQNVYKDSISLMAITNKVNQLEGVIQSSIGMGTQMNKTIIQDIGFDAIELSKAKESDMLIALSLESDTYFEAVLETFDSFLVVKQEDDDTNKAYTNTKHAIHEQEANIAIISIPGNQAYRDVKTCLENGLNVMLFSDNMSIEDEKSLKEFANSKDLLLMGPDCGTAIINGVGLCFSNQVRTGNIGIVGASGTGIQEVCVLIDRYGAGVSHAIGTGGRDLSEDIGGIMMLKGMDLLEQDEKTEVILLVSKPPAPSVATKILEKVKLSNKKYVVCFINGKFEDSQVTFAKTLEEAAMMSASSSLNIELAIDTHLEAKIIEEQAAKHTKDVKYLRALYCGGTLAAETDMIVQEHFKVYSNVTKYDEMKLDNPFVSVEHTIVDLGDDVFTQGKPHPMIDPSIRNERIIQEAQDPQTAVMILDFELGYGSNNDPVGLTLPAIEKALSYAKEQDRHLTIICYLLTTDSEKQNVHDQYQLLRSLDVVIAQSNAQAARIACKIINHLK